MGQAGVQLPHRELKPKVSAERTVSRSNTHTSTLHTQVYFCALGPVVGTRDTEKRGALSLPSKGDQAESGPEHSPGDVWSQRERQQCQLGGEERLMGKGLYSQVQKDE